MLHKHLLIYHLELDLVSWTHLYIPYSLEFKIVFRYNNQNYGILNRINPYTLLHTLHSFVIIDISSFMFWCYSWSLGLSIHLFECSIFHIVSHQNSLCQQINAIIRNVISHFCATLINTSVRFDNI